MVRITKKKTRDIRFVVLAALAFWGWLGAPMLYAATGFEPPTGKLILSVIIVLILLFVAGEPKHTPREQVVHALRLRSIAAIMFFLTYCTLHAFISGSAYSIFKLQQLTINIVVAYALSYKAIRAIEVNKTLFFIVGFLIGVATYYTVFSEMKTIMVEDAFRGLKGMPIGILIYQDYYVMLLLFTTVILFASTFHYAYLFMFVATATMSVPMVIGFNSRMIPFTVGGTIFYMIVTLRSVLSKRGNKMRNMVVITLVAIAGMMFVGNLVHRETAMMRVFNEGPWQSYRQGYRYLSFTKAAEDFWESPLYGIGFGRFNFWGNTVGLTRDSGMWAHNMFLELLGELGLIGFVLFVFATGRTFMRVLFVRFRSNQEFLVFPCVLLVYIVATMQLSRNIVYPFLWVGLFCCEAAFHYDRYSFSGLKRTDTAESV